MAVEVKVSWFTLNLHAWIFVIAGREEAISDCYASIVIERMVVMYLKGNNVSFNFLKGSSHKHKRNEKQKSGINVMVATNSVSLSCIRNY